MENNLFSQKLKSQTTPLSHKVRPKTPEDFVGQEEILQNRLFRNTSSETNNSLIIFGPPGCGKTTLAHIIASQYNCELIKLNGAQSSVTEVRDAIIKADDNMSIGKNTLVFVDEIHRFNKAQQDSLLDPIERGIFKFIGATTENPFFSVTGSLLSRCSLIELKELKPEEIKKILQRVLDIEYQDLDIDQQCLNFIVGNSNGDARVALNLLELAYQFSEPYLPGTNKTEKVASPKVSLRRHIDLDNLKLLDPRKHSTADKDSSNHYDQISAYVKSMRGSDPDASLYWLARLLFSGTDPLYIARRLVIHAAEDVGLADPTALQSAIAAQRAVETIGLPEAKIPLAMATLHIALAPKSNSSCAGIKKAMEFVEKSSNTLGPVPNHLKDAHYKGATKIGRGAGYLFPHDYPENEGYVAQNYLPENLKNSNLSLYQPSNIGYEQFLYSKLNERKSNLSKKED